MKSDFDKFADTVAKIIADGATGDESIPPVVIGQEPDGTIHTIAMIGIPLNATGARAAAIQAVSRVLKEHKCLRYSFTSEAWAKNPQTGERREIVFIMVVDKSGFKQLTYQEIFRKEDKTIDRLGAPTPSTIVDSPWAELLS